MKRRYSLSSIHLLADGTIRFSEIFLPFQRMIARLGLYNSLCQCLLKLSAPGVPDIYQGCELWNFCLVDPDNRQPVDYGARIAMLSELKSRSAHDRDDRLAAELLATPNDGKLKLFITWRLLSFRKQNEDLFLHGSYIPLKAIGIKAEHLLAFSRRLGKKLVITVCTRFFASLTDKNERLPSGAVWAETYLEAPDDGTGNWHNILTGVRVHTKGLDNKEVFVMEDIFPTLPIAILEYLEK